MEKTIISTGIHESVILVGEKWTNASEYLPEAATVIITDENVEKIYGREFPRYPVFKVPAGEKSKSLPVVESLTGQLLDSGLDRSGFVLAVGGGVVCDLAGFLASVYMRGIRFGFVSTTLLSQVDASVGGKNAVNVGGRKNIIGTFSQPDFVICDPSMLSTLPEDEYLSGLSELIKMGFILDETLVDDIEKNQDAILRRDINLMENLIIRSVRLKGAVVRADEKEEGLRMILNFGHTFGHIIESAAGLKHGFAVASGMVIAADISVSQGSLGRPERDRLVNLLGRFNLLTGYRIPASELEKSIHSDKKKNRDTINFVLLDSIGKARVEAIRLNDLVSAFNKTVINEG